MIIFIEAEADPDLKKGLGGKILKILKILPLASLAVLGSPRLIFRLILSIWPNFPDYFYVTRPPDFLSE